MADWIRMPFEVDEWDRSRDGCINGSADRRREGAVLAVNVTIATNGDFAARSKISECHWSGKMRLERRCADIWHLVASKVKKHDVTYSLEPSVKYAQLEFFLYLDRKPLYYIVNIMVPCSFLVVISLLVSQSHTFSRRVAILIGGNILSFRNKKCQSNLGRDVSPPLAAEHNFAEMFPLVTMG